MEKVIEIIKNLGWPHFTFIFAIIFIFVFKPQIGSFISRIRSVGKKGIKADALPEAQYDETRKQVVEELMNLGDTPLLIEVEALIREDLKSRELEYQGDTVSILIRHLAATKIAYAFEQAYNSIFGSQIYLLKQLHQVAGEGVTRKYIQSYFDKVLKLYPEELKTWDTDQYLRYLFLVEFITLQDNKYHITIKGTEFLIWLTKYARSEDKRF